MIRGADNFVIGVFEGEGASVASSADDLVVICRKRAFGRKHVRAREEGQRRWEAALHREVHDEERFHAAGAGLLPRFVGDAVRARRGVARTARDAGQELERDVGEHAERLPFGEVSLRDGVR